MKDDEFKNSKQRQVMTVMWPCISYTSYHSSSKLSSPKRAFFNNDKNKRSKYFTHVHWKVEGLFVVKIFLTSQNDIILYLQDEMKFK